MSRKVDLTPTWSAVLPIIVRGLRSDNEASRENALAELANMALAADRWNTRLALVDRYNAALNEQEIAPNGDDYNALLDLLAGGEYRAPIPGGR